MLSGLRTVSRSAMALPFKPVDVAAQARAMRLEARGRQDGAEEMPASDMPGLAEQEVRSAIMADRDRCANDLASQLRAARDALAQLQTAMDIAGIQHAADEAVAGLEQIRSSWSGEIFRLRREAVEAKTEYDAFRAKYRLGRAARQPHDRRMGIALLVVAVAAESLLNGVFFAEGSDLGLLGGVSLALLISFFNVIVGAINGVLFLRMMHHSKLWAKLIGVVMFVITLSVVVMLNGFIAHFRDVYQNVGENYDLRLIGRSLIQTPFELISIQSWALFLAGLLFSGFATIKAYGFDDPHPGYGAVDRRWRAREDAYAISRQDFIDEAADIRDACLSRLSKAIESLRGASSQRQQLLAGRARMMAEFRQHESHLEQAGQQLLTIYRHANSGARSTPSPQHFGEHFTFTDRALDRPEMAMLLIDQGLQHDADSLIAELDRLRTRVIGAYQSMLDDAPAEA